MQDSIRIFDITDFTPKTFLGNQITYYSYININVDRKHFWQYADYLVTINSNKNYSIFLMNVQLD